MTAPLVSIVTLNFNGRQHLAECIPTLLDLEAEGIEHEILVVDNGSRDGSVAWLRETYPQARYPRLRLIESGANLGFTGGNNLAARQARGQYLAFVNNDTRVERGWLRALVEAIEAAPADVAAVAGTILDWSGERIDFVEGLVTFDGHAFQQDFHRPLAAAAPRAAGRELWFACGGNMLIRRAVFEEVGGFDEAFFAYMEDVDLGWRLWLAGYRILFAPAAVVRHRSAATSILLGIYNRGFLFEKNAFMVVYKNFGEERLAAFLPAILYTFMHRSQILLARRNRGGETLEVDPVAGGGGSDGHASPAPALVSLAAKWRAYGAREFLRRGALKLLGGMPRSVQGPAVVLNDPHTLMQLRAASFLMRHREELARARAAVQSLRRRSDEEIFSRFSLHLVATYPGDDELFASEFFRALLPSRFPLRETRLADIMELGESG